jgi:hypothetical protein
LQEKPNPKRVQLFMARRGAKVRAEEETKVKKEMR